MAGCSENLKQVALDPQQLLSDGLQVIAKRYSNFSLKQSIPDSENLFRRKIADAQFYWTGYCVGMAIALARDYLSLLDRLVARDNFAALSIDFKLVYFERAIVNGIRDAAYQNSEELRVL